MFSREPRAPEAERLARLVAVSRRLAADSDLRSVLTFLIENALAMTGAERGFFIFRRHGGVTCEASVPPGAALPGPVPPQLSRSVLSRALEGGECVLSTDLAADERFRARLSVRRLGLRSVLAVPFPGRTGATGVLYLDSRVQHTLFRPEDVALMEAFAAQASMALDHALLAAERSARPESGNSDDRRQAGVEPPVERRTPFERGDRDDRAIPAAENRPFERALRGSPESARHIERALPPGRPRSLPPASFPSIIGSAPSMKRVLDMIGRVGSTDLPVLIVGESGTGKELIARAIHAASPRRSGPFVGENCAAIPETLIESELFGSVRGAFTGAERDRDGLFRAAEGGSLFLDEIGEMPLSLQARLLRALQEGEVRPVGSPRSLRVNVRVIAATNRDPVSAIASDRLRLDLYYRLAGVSLEIPALRDRRKDIPELAEHFLARCASVHGTRASRLSAAAVSRLVLYDWPGNVRELENEIERAAVLAPGDVIEAEDLSPRVSGESGTTLHPGRSPAERTMIESALLGASGSVTAAAQAIGWSRQKLYRRMVRLGVPPSFGRRAPA